MESPVDKVYKIIYILKDEIHLYVCLSIVLTEEARTKKQLKRSKSKKVKKANVRYAMLDSLAACFFMTLKMKKISTGLNEG